MRGTREVSGAAPRRDRRTPAALAAGVALLYVAFSGWSIRDMGYNGEDLLAVHDLFRFVAGALGLGPPFHPTRWPRHGFMSIASHAPFVAAARILFGGDPAAEDRIVSLEPLLATVLIVALVFLWVRRASGSAIRAYGVALLAAFSTLLWPYAYTGLETTQSAALVLAGYLAFATTSRSWGRSLLFGAAAAFALSAKATSIFLLPAVGWASAEFLGMRRGSRTAPRAGFAPRVAVLSFVAGAFFANAWSRTFWWAQLGGTAHVIDKWLVRDPVVFLVHAVSLFGSANKGLFFYCPVLIAAALVLGRAWKRERGAAVFAVLTTLGLAAGFSMIRNWWADETWGPRYLHSAVAPLLVVLGVAWERGAMPRAWRRTISGLGTVGLVISLLGVFFYYGALQTACTRASQSTLETLQGDPVWNHVVFNGRLFRAWARGASSPSSSPVIWVPAHYWWYETPPDFREWKGVDLRRFATPRPLLFRRPASLSPGGRRLRMLSAAALAIGLALLVAAASKARRWDGPPGSAPARGFSSMARGRLLGLGIPILFGATLLWSWALSWRATLDRRLYLAATVIDDTPAFRRALAAVERRVPRTGTVLGVVEGADWNATHWSRWLYPRRVIWMTPARARRLDPRFAREGLGIRVAIVVGERAARAGAVGGRIISVAEGAEVRELMP